MRPNAERELQAIGVGGHGDLPAGGQLLALATATVSNRGTDSS